MFHVTPIGDATSSTEVFEYMSQSVVFWVRLGGETKTIKTKGGIVHALKHRMMSNIIMDDLYIFSRDSYLKGIGRELLEMREV